MSEEIYKRGFQLDRYEIRELIGQGGMGQVYRAWDQSLRRDVAIKILNILDSSFLRRFSREAKVISQLSHPNIVEILDYRVGDARPYIVMEYLRGKNLNNRLSEAPIKIDEAVDLVLGVCSGVHECHHRGIIHRDLKPGNVFLNETSDFGTVVKVLDFGIASLSQAEDDLTHPGQVVGTPRYFAPEQFLNQEADEKSDQYSVGILLYATLTRSLPFKQELGTELKRAILAGDFATPRAKNIKIPEELESIVLRAMHLHRGERYSSLRQLGFDLLKYASEGGKILWHDQFAVSLDEKEEQSNESRVGENKPNLPVHHPFLPPASNDNTRFDPLTSEALAQKISDENSTTIYQEIGISGVEFIEEEQTEVECSPSKTQNKSDGPKVQISLVNLWTDTKEASNNASSKSILVDSEELPTTPISMGKSDRSMKAGFVIPILAPLSDETYMPAPIANQKIRGKERPVVHKNGVVPRIIIAKTLQKSKGEPQKRWLRKELLIVTFMIAAIIVCAAWIWNSHSKSIHENPPKKDQAQAQGVLKNDASPDSLDIKDGSGMEIAASSLNSHENNEETAKIAVYQGESPSIRPNGKSSQKYKTRGDGGKKKERIKELEYTPEGSPILD